jgi:23S rRNA-/tRNA-specific pseudouridylate synthase
MRINLFFNKISFRNFCSGGLGLTNTLNKNKVELNINVPTTPNKNKYLEIKISDSENTNLRLDRFIMNKYNLHWDTLQKSFRNNDVFIIREENNSNPTKIKIPKEKLNLNDKVYISKRLIESIDDNINQLKTNKNIEKLDLETIKNLESLFYSMIVLQSKELMIINKMTNLACQDGSMLKFSLDTMLSILNTNPKSEFNLKLVHRLDKNVSGLMLIGNQIDTVRKFGEIIKNSQMEKNYLTMVQGVPMFLKLMLRETKLNVNNTDHFINSMKGYIKSTEECDEFLIELDNKIDFSLDSNRGEFRLIKNTSRAVTKDRGIYNMFGKFKISHLIFFDRSKRVFKSFNMQPEEFTKYSHEDLSVLKSYIDEIERNPGDDKFNTKENIECYSLVLYELVSGKKHQIRKHMSKCFFTPIVKDQDYMFNDFECRELMKLLKEEKNMPDEKQIKKNVQNNGALFHFMEKYKINNFDESILLQSLHVSFPKMNLSNLKIKNSFVKTETIEKESESKFSVKLNKLNDNFSKVFKLMKLSKLIEAENYKI